jgi:hypothetical protein
VPRLLLGLVEPRTSARILVDFPKSTRYDIAIAITQRPIEVPTMPRIHSYKNNADRQRAYRLRRGNAHLTPIYQDTWRGRCLAAESLAAAQTRRDRDSTSP